MKIGIIGAGSIGATLARKLAACGHEIRLANSKGPETISTLARTVGAIAVPKEEAVRHVTVIILSVPISSIPNLSSILETVPAEVTVIDTTNYYPFRDGNISGIDSGKPESLWVSEKISRPVIKAWNAVLAATLDQRGRPKGAPDRIAVPVAGDNQMSKNIAMGLVEETGFDALDAGKLDSSWRQQPGTPAYCTELVIDALKSALQRADQFRAPNTRDALIKEFMTAEASLSHDEIVARNRAATA